MNIKSCLQQVSQLLDDTSETPLLDAQVLLASLLGVTRTWVLAHPDEELNPEKVSAFYRSLGRLRKGEALPYLLGYWDFYGLKFEISPATLIPRPETELLVEQAIGWLRETPNRCCVADVGTGSGCIAVSLAVHVPDLCVYATDISHSALKVAKKNAKRHRVSENMHLVQANLLSPFSTRLPNQRGIDLVCANLPYIQTDTLVELDVARREPWSALHGGKDGLHWIRNLLSEAHRLLSSTGLLLIEIDPSQRVEVLEIARKYYPQSQSMVLPDLSGRDRLLVVEQKEITKKRRGR